MRKLAVVLVIAAIAVYAMPVFAGDAPAGKCEGKSVFQKMSDEITGCKASSGSAVEPAKKGQVRIFQEMSDDIATGSAKARKESLRTK